MMEQSTTPPTWLGIGILLLAALGLALFALVVVGLVIVKSGRAGELQRRLKSVGLAALLVAAALSVVGLAGAGLLTVRTVGLTSTTFDFSARQTQAATAMLHVRETLPREPDWAKPKPELSDGGVLVTLSSERFATLAEAEEQVTERALAFVRDRYHKEYPLPGEWKAPVSLVKQHAVKSLVGEELDKDFGNGLKTKMYRAHVQLELNSQLNDAVHEWWRGQVVNQRLTTLGTGLGLITVLLGATAGYLRLNALTHGEYGTRLKLAAISVVGAAGLGVLALR
jgi:hypothetical protein